MSSSSYRRKTSESGSVSSHIEESVTNDIRTQNFKVKKLRMKVGIKRSSTFFKFEDEKVALSPHKRQKTVIQTGNLKIDNKSNRSANLPENDKSPDDQAVLMKDAITISKLLDFDFEGRDNLIIYVKKTISVCETSFK